MPVAIRPRPPTVNATVKTVLVGESDVASIAHSRVLDGIAQLEDAQRPRSKVTATLTAGTNTISHGLGRQPTSCHVTPTTADAGFAYALTSADTKQAVVTTVGSTQTNAVLEFS